MPIIRQLSDKTICRIAAGEVIERPAGAVKELLENSIDAGASQINVVLINGGRDYISISDNGCGISAMQLPLALARHATSKLQQTDVGDDDWWNIQSLGFRGEALAALAAVSQLALTSRPQNADTAWRITCDYGNIHEAMPAAGDYGTHIEVKNLFGALPARAAFLKSARSETTAVLETVRAVAGANPQVAFSLHDDDKEIFNSPAATDAHFVQRLNDIIASDFAHNAFWVDISFAALHVCGWAGLPTYSRSTSVGQYFFVNRRRVRDKIFAVALKMAYRNYLEKDRYPIAALYLQAPPHFVDCNVHPTKAEVRFKEPDAVRRLIVQGIEQGLERAAHRTAPAVAQQAVAVLTHNNMRTAEVKPSFMYELSAAHNLGLPKMPTKTPYQPNFLPAAINQSAPMAQEPSVVPLTSLSAEPLSNKDLPPLGYAKAQLHRSYIVSQTADGLVLIDQHAAHERVTMYRMKEHWQAQKTQRQALLLPVTVALSVDAMNAIVRAIPKPEQLGFVFDIMPPSTLVVREVPVLLPSDVCLTTLLKDFTEQLLHTPDDTPLAQHLIDELLANSACRASIKNGRTLSLDEMNALLRQIEQTPYAGQCNHGRPTMIHLSLKDIEKLFSRR